MEDALEKAKKAVAECNAKSDSSYVKTVKALLAAVAECKQYIKDNASTDRGCAQRIARSLDEILEQMPGGRKIAGEKTSAHNRRLAEAQIESLETQLKAKLTENEERKEKQIKDWVKKHPVFRDLKRMAGGPLPKGAYALLFTQGEGETAELVSQSTQDGRVFTRFKPQEFKDDVKIYKQYKSRAAIVGAAMIAEKELLVVIGQVPAAEEGTELVQHLLSLSSQTAGTPVREFLEKNATLKQLHDLASKHKIPKQCFILLFRNSVQEDNVAQPEIVVKSTAEGKTVTRYWPNEFSDKYKLFDNFRDKPEITGAAVIHESKLLHEIGSLPQPPEGRTQLQVLLETSGKVMERPMLDFISDNEVLKGLLELASGQSPPRDAYVLLFIQGEGGKVDVLSPPGRGPQKQSRTLLSDFVTARAIHERFTRLPRVVGASVIGEQSPSGRRNEGSEGKPRSREGDARKRPGATVASKPVVLAAFGRTPLKAGHVANAETLQRLGIKP